MATISNINTGYEITNIDTEVCTKDFIDPNAHIKDVEHPNLSKAQQKQFDRLLERNKDIFAQNEWDIGRTSILEAKIDTDKATPVRKKPYRTPIAYRSEVKRQVRCYRLKSSNLVTQTGQHP